MPKTLTISEASAHFLLTDEVYELMSRAQHGYITKKHYRTLRAFIAELLAEVHEISVADAMRMLPLEHAPANSRIPREFHAKHQRRVASDTNATFDEAVRNMLVVPASEKDSL